MPESITRHCLRLAVGLGHQPYSPVPPVVNFRDAQSIDPECSTCSIPLMLFQNPPRHFHNPLDLASQQSFLSGALQPISPYMKGVLEESLTLSP